MLWWFQYCTNEIVNHFLQLNFVQVISLVILVVDTPFM